MADRVHPTTLDSPTPHSQAEAYELEEKKLISNPAPTPPPGRSVSILIPPGNTTAPPGTYIVQLPKDQILRQPPPPKRPPYHGRNPRRRRSRCCCCCLCLLITLLLLVIFAAVFAGVFYFVYQPKVPKYSIDSLSIQGFNVTSSASSSTFSPRMDVSVRAQNPNTKIGIYYAKGSSVQVSHSDIGGLCTGVLPVFYQPTKNTTIFRTVLKSTDPMILGTQNYKILMDQEKKKQIPLNMKMEVPVKIKFGSIKTWTIIFKVRCAITVNGLTIDASIVDKDCSVKFKPWE